MITKYLHQSYQHVQYLHAKDEALHFHFSWKHQGRYYLHLEEIIYIILFPPTPLNSLGFFLKRRQMNRIVLAQVLRRVCNY